jgi:hypothetical protein
VHDAPWLLFALLCLVAVQYTISVFFVTIFFRDGASMFDQILLILNRQKKYY